MMETLFAITPDMLGAGGVLLRNDFTTPGITRIEIDEAIPSIIFDQSLNLPSASIILYGATNVEIRGDVVIDAIRSDGIENPRSPKGNLTVLGNLTAKDRITINGGIAVQGSIDVKNLLWAKASIHCTGSLKSFVTGADEKIFVKGAMTSPSGIVCQDLTIHSDQPMPAFSAPRPSSLKEFQIMLDFPGTLPILPDMVDADGILRNVNFGAGDLCSIDIHQDVRLLIIDQPLDLPGVAFNICGETDIQIRGNAHLLWVMVDGNDLCKLTVHGDLTVTRNVRLYGTIHVTGSINVTEDIWAAGSLHCNGSIKARFIAVRHDIFVDETIEAPGGIACRNLTMYSDHPMPKYTAPMVYG